jgi:hypothetical protein
MTKANANSAWSPRHECCKEKSKLKCRFCSLKRIGSKCWGANFLESYRIKSDKKLICRRCGGKWDSTSDFINGYCPCCVRDVLGNDETTRYIQNLFHDMKVEEYDLMHKTSIVVDYALALAKAVKLKRKAKGL